MNTFYTRLQPPSLLFLLLFIWCQTTHAQVSNKKPAQSAQIADYQGRPTIFIDKVPVSPMMYALTHAYGGRWSWEERPSRNLQSFCESGIRLFQVDLHFEDLWMPGQDQLDLTKAQKQVRGVLDVCPDASIVIRLHLNAPFWWNVQHPNECTTYANGKVDQRNYGPPFNMEDGDIDRPLRASLASSVWRKEAGEKLVEFCKRFATTPEGKSVIGLHLAGGVYGEWHYWGFIKHEPDTGSSMTDYFRKWLQKQYQTTENLQKNWNSTIFTLENATVPDTTERNLTTDGIFRTAAKEQRVIDYFKAQQEVVVEDIEYFCRLAKQHWGRPLIVGVFYGYLHSTFSRQAIGGHIMIERILNCPDIDYLAAPQTYWENSRKLGGSSHARGLVESTRLHHKLWMDEVDNGYLQANRALDFVRSAELSDTNYAAILRRSTLLPLLRGMGMWYYDFGPQRSTGWWDSPLYLPNIKADRAFFEQQRHQPYLSVADVLYVYDQSHFYYLKNKKTAISESVIDQGVEDAMRCGVVGDHIYLFDLDKVDLSQYKAVMFVNCYKMTIEQRTFIMDKVAQQGRTIIWNYLPGYLDGTENKLAFVTALTGIPCTTFVAPAKPSIQMGDVAYTFDGLLEPAVAINDLQSTPLAQVTNGKNEVVVARRKFKTHTSVFAAFPLQKSDVFRNVFREAGCHIYQEKNDFTYAHDQLILLHTATGGIREITLKNGKKVSIALKSAATVLIDWESGVVVLE